MNHTPIKLRNKTGTAGFTLIELLVVIAIIALLVGILLPALGQARASARALKTGVNLRSAGMGVVNYNSTYNGVYPLSYVYPRDNETNEWRMADQTENPPPGVSYLHWSYMLFGGDKGGGVNEESFTSPAAPGGGAPRTNPGPNPEDWVGGQSDGQGATSPTQNSLKDRQTARVAFAGNGAIFARNKFAIAGTPRRQQFVRDNWIDNPSGTILATEYHFKPGWATLKSTGDANGPIKSHRPIMPFVGISAGGNVLSEPVRPITTNFWSFRYNTEAEIYKESDIPDGVIDDSNSPISAVGRMQPGKDSKGGSANFVFCDGHVEQTTLLETVKKRRWGNKVFSVSGDNAVNPN